MTTVSAPRSIRSPRWLFVAYFAVLLVIVAATVPVLVGTVQALDRQHALYDPAATATSELLIGALNEETGSRGYALTGDPQFLQPYSLGSAQYDAATAALGRLALSRSIGTDVRSTEAAYSDWRSIADQLVADVHRGNLAAARSLAEQSVGKARFDTYRTQQAHLSAALGQEVADSRHTLKLDVLLALVVLLAATAAGMGVGVGMIVWWRIWGRRSVLEETRLADQGVLLQAAIDSSSEGIFAKDLSGRHILANRSRATALSGGDPTVTVVGRAVDEFVDTEQAQQIRRAESEVVATGQGLDLEEILAQPDGPHTFAVRKNPLLDSQGRLIGIVGVARDVTEEQQLLADRERLHQLEHEFAETIQRAMTGHVSVTDARLEVAVRYEPAHDQLSVGGDWCDAFQLSPNRIGLAVGDAVGHGISSATAMGQLRSALTALTGITPSPASAIEALDRFASTLPTARSATCLLAWIDLAADQLLFSSAGHMPPLVVTHDGEPRILDNFQDIPLAADRAATRRNASVPFPIGSLVVLYTDGLIETRGVSIDVGFERLRDVVRSRAQVPVKDLADRLVVELVDVETQNDDVALIVARRSG